MLFNRETKYWQEEYEKGNLDDEDMPGEIHALLDGTAEKGLKIMLKCMGIVVIVTLVSIFLFECLS